jgi:hypothetical protein
VHAARVTTAGEVLDVEGLRVDSGTPLEIRPQSIGVTWDGASFIVTWTRTHQREEPPGSGLLRTFTDVLAARLTAGGARPDGGAILLRGDAPSARLGATTAIASRVRGESLVGYNLPTIDHGPQRAVVRLFTSGAPGVACSAADDCDSRHCVDGVCCDRPCEGACEACSVATGSSADGTCSALASETVCRPASGLACDVAELCDGSSRECPADVPAPGCEAPDGGMVPAVDAGTRPDAGNASGTDAGTSTGDSGMTTTRDAGAPPSTMGGGCQSVAARGTAHLGALFIAVLLTCAARRRRTR